MEKAVMAKQAMDRRLNIDDQGKNPLLKGRRSHNSHMHLARPLGKPGGPPLDVRGVKYSKTLQTNKLTWVKVPCEP